MDQFVEVFKLISPSALPLVVVLLGGFWIYRKTQNIEQARKLTKAERDQDSQKMHDDLLKHSFEITNLKDIVSLHKDRLESIDKQLGIVNQELVRLNLQVEHLTEALKEQNLILKETIQNARATSNAN